jgi:glutathione S-transferase
MKLVGMLDSPYVRRVAISLKLLGIPFEHQAVSVFRHFDQFRTINPLVKAPTLVCDNGVVLMESGLILDYLEQVAGRSLMAPDLLQRQHDLRTTGLALTACEKTVQIMYECDLRPAERQHAPWVERVQGQLEAAYAALEHELGRVPAQLDEAALTQADVTTAVAWRFTQYVMADRIPAAHYPLLGAFSAAAERLPAFESTPLD